MQFQHNEWKTKLPGKHGRSGLGDTRYCSQRQQARSWLLEQAQHDAQLQEIVAAEPSYVPGQVTPEPLEVKVLRR
jgi:hypothetical protein